ncbi:hypothetical protein QBC34DRAFT_401595 [Podospora aff. communis PSN243]|uniref:DUF7924 domain-containing protein n=1 Tax=Podospora aff. communis PSN243 TaxID=3040156 RepID=A0AAV9GSL0_9PEZI|nr:hypothetical protein QBC34DRAFT_401595 [Podospora aff. communis PSN243]
MMRQTQSTAIAVNRNVPLLTSEDQVSGQPKASHQVTAMASNGDVPSLDDGDEVSVSVVSHYNTPADPLTRKNLARLNALNGYVKDYDTDSAYLFDDETDDTMKKVSTIDSAFERRAYHNGILDPIASRPPQGLSIIRNYTTQRRTSTQPSERAHQTYFDKVSNSYNENDISHLIQSRIMREYNDPQYNRAHGRAITEIPSQDFNNGLSNPFPDVLEGLVTKVLPYHLHDNALHKKNSLSFCHFAAEFKRTDGNLHQATVQAAYNGAVLVNARNRALAEARQDGTVTAAAIDKAAEEAAVFTCVTDGKVAEVYTHHSEGGQYYQNLVARESLLDYPNRGRELIRNTQDYARSKSYELANLLSADLEEEEEEEEAPLKAKKAVVEAKGGSFWPW